MGLLHLAVLGSPEVFHEEKRLTFSLRKAQALLLYLAVEGGMHSRGKLAAFLWPDSEPRDARTALRNALALLRNLLAHADASSPVPDHLLNQGDLIGLDPQAPLTLDQTAVLQAYQHAQGFVTNPSEQQRLALVTELQQALALVRGPFLDGFWLGDEAPFDEWIEQQQQQWQVRLHLLFDRLSSWHEVGGEFEQAKAILTRWLALDPLNEEAYRRLMRVHLALGDPGAALQVYTTCRTRLAEELQVKPAPGTMALAERARTALARNSDRSPTQPATAAQKSQPPGDPVSPLIGRSAAFNQLVSRYQIAQQGHPQLVIAEGIPGIGKTRLAMEFLAWARAQGAEVLVGHAIETGGRLPYQPLVEAMRLCLEEENAPEDLLEDVWLAELSRLLPELRVRYPDLPAPTQDEMVSRLRLFEAVARLLDALAQRGPLVLLLDDAQWIDAASVDLSRYLARHWQEQSTHVLLLTTIRSDDLEVNPIGEAVFSDLRRYLSGTQITLQRLSREETQQLVDAMIDASVLPLGRKGRKRRVPIGSSPVVLESEPESRRGQVALAHFLFTHSDGHPLILIETLKLMQDRQWLVPKPAEDGSWRWVLVRDIAEILTEEESGRKLLPPSVRAMILARLARLTPNARQLTMAAAVLSSQVTAQVLWQVAELRNEAGLEALEEAIKSGLLREVEGRRGKPSSYRIFHELGRDILYTELGEARRRLLHQRALQLLSTEGKKAATLAYHALAAGEIEAAYRYYVQAGDEALALLAVEEAIGQYEQARSLFHEQVQENMLELYQTKSLSSITAQDIASHQTSFPHLEHLYVSLGQAYTFLQAEEQAQEIYEELLAYARQQQLSALVSMTLNRLAIRAVKQSLSKPEVLALLEEARHMAESSQDQQVLAETGWNQAQLLLLMGEDLKSILLHLERALEQAQSNSNQELEARILCARGIVCLWKGDFREAREMLKEALALYANLDSKPEAALEHTLPFLVFEFDTASLSQRLTTRLAEALIRGFLGFAQLQDGQVQEGMRHGRKALEIARETRSTWSQIDATVWLSYGLQETGAYEEALGLLLQAIELARPYPMKTFFYTLHLMLGSTYQALQQWEEAQTVFDVVETNSEAVTVEPLRIFLQSRLCMNAALTGQWERAYHYAMKAVALRKHSEAAFMPLDFVTQYETEALLRRGKESLAREELQRREKHLEPYTRFRLPYLQSQAVLTVWEGQSEQAIGHLQEAAQLAAEIGLPGELWQIQARLGTLYQASGQQERADMAFGEVQSILQKLAEAITDEALRAKFLVAPSIQRVRQHVQNMVSQTLHSETIDQETLRR